MSLKDFFIDRIDWRFERIAPLYWPFLRLIGKASAAGRECRVPSAGNTITVTMMTYNRPEYFRRTVESFASINNNLLKKVKLIILVQGDGDEGTKKVINSYRKVFTEILRPGLNLGTAGGYSYLMEQAIATGCDYVLHLEDDWESRESLEDYINDALFVLANHKNVGYIRLRSIREKTSYINLVTRRPIIYKPITQFVWVCNGHYTFNPSLIKTSVIRHIIPATSEASSEKKYELLGLCAAQLMANCFVHIGEERVNDWVR